MNIQSFATLAKFIRKVFPVTTAMVRLRRGNEYIKVYNTSRGFELSWVNDHWLIQMNDGLTKHTTNPTGTSDAFDIEQRIQLYGTLDLITRTE